MTTATATRVCPECNDLLPVETFHAYEWLYGGHKMDVLGFAKELRKTDGAFAFADGDDEAVLEAFEYTVGHSPAALVAAMQHRRWEDGP